MPQLSRPPWPRTWIYIVLSLPRVSRLSPSPCPWREFVGSVAVVLRIDGGAGCDELVDAVQHVGGSLEDDQAEDGHRDVVDKSKFQGHAFHAMQECGVVGVQVSTPFLSGWSVQTFSAKGAGP